MSKFIESLFAALEIVVLERIEPGLFKASGSLPDWFIHLYPEASAESNQIRPGKKFAFLENFMVDAEDYWKQNEKGRLTSGPWIEVDPSGTEWDLEASAVCAEESKILLIEFARIAFKEKQNLVQKGREKNFDYRSLARSQKVLRKVEARHRALLHAIPDQVFLLNREGVCLDYKADQDRGLLIPSGGFVGKNIFDMLPGDLSEPLRERMQRAIKTDEIETFRYRLEVQGNARDYEVRLAGSGEEEVIVLVREIARTASPA